MSIGDLRKVVTLQSEQLQPDGNGGQIGVWADVASMAADMRPVDGSAAVVTAGFERRLTHKVTVRYRAGITTGMRFVLGTRFFLIRSVVNRGEANQWLDMMVEEGGLLGS